MSGIGHNLGPTLEPGASWRRHCWTAARAALLPKLPVEIVRQHVRRAVEIGLDYRTYAGVRATTGHDLVAFLFSTNALRLLRERDRMAAAEAGKLAGLSGIGRLVAAQPPLVPGAVRDLLAGQGVAIDAARPCTRPCRRLGRDAGGAARPSGRDARAGRPRAGDLRDRARTGLVGGSAACRFPAGRAVFRPGAVCSSLNSRSALAKPGRLGYRGRG